MKSIPFFLALIVEAKSRNCGDYNFYRDDAKNFIKQCSKRERLSMNDKTPVIDASKFHGDEFNVFFSRLRRFEVCIRVQNTKLKRIAFPAISEAAKAKCPNALASIVIRDNPNLEEIVFGKSNKVRASAIPTLMVRGNRKLTNETITKLNELKAGGRASMRNSIQVFGECSVPKPLRNLSDFIGCEWLHGDIRVDRNQLSFLPPSQPLKPFTLTGCVIVKHSKIENIDFLRNIRRQLIPTWQCDNEILDNANLCIHEDFERILRSRIDHLNMSIPENCEIICVGGIVTPEYIATTITGHHCAVIRGDLILRNWKGNSSDLQDLKFVRRIFGALRLEGNLQLKKVDFLTGLEEINMGTKAKGAGVIIKDNPVLEEVQLVSLKKVISGEPITVVIENNPKLAADMDEWYEIAGGANRTKLVLADLGDHGGDGITSLVIQIVAIVALLLVLILIVYWCGWGSRWNKFSGLLPQTETGTTPTDKRPRSKK